MRRAATAFTLIELLVVMATIGIFASLLPHALSQAKEAGHARRHRASEWTSNSFRFRVIP